MLRSQYTDRIHKLLEEYIGNIRGTNNISQGLNLKNPVRIYWNGISK